MAISYGKMLTMLSDDEKTALLVSIQRVRQAVEVRLGINPDAWLAIHFIENLHRAVDKVAAELPALGSPAACKEGCDWCCSVRVEASEPEVFRIVRELRKLPATQVDEILQRLQRHQAAHGALAPHPPGIACAFLDNRRCTIYSIRPAVCRKAHSLSAERCQEGARELPQNLTVVVAADALVRGTAEAYRQCGIRFSTLELCGAVLLALTDDTAEARWHLGDATF